MSEVIELKNLEERVLLVAVSEHEKDDTIDSLEELAQLVETAGAIPVGTIIQSRSSIHPGTYVGSGKIDEIRKMIEETNATGIVCDDELSPAQIRNLEELLDTKIMDRTLVILDIFASRASTGEGKIQVELAQLKYRLSRLAGLGRSMSRLGGGIGTRGPGEKKLEMDRRLIKDRISQLKEELEAVCRHRDVTRAKRRKKNLPVIAIVGYTNAGKSTLLNHLTNAKVYEEDQLFATLDPTTRILELPGKQEVLLTDTVGFIRKLPHHLIEAFKSTLEEAKYSDYIFHVLDASNPQMEKQMHIVYQTLEQLGVKDKPIITIFNKQDKRMDAEPLHDFRADYTHSMSAAKDEGIEELKDLLLQILRDNKIYVEWTIPYKNAGILQEIRMQGELLEEEYVADGIAIKAYIPMEVYGRYEQTE